MRETTIKVYRRTEETVSLQGWPDTDRLAFFAAHQIKAEEGYILDLTFRYEGGPEYGADIKPDEPMELQFLINPGNGEWENVSHDEPLYPGDPLTLCHIESDVRRFARTHFFAIREEDK